MEKNMSNEGKPIVSLLLILVGLQFASFGAYSAAPVTTIDGNNTQEVELTGLVGSVGVALNGNLVSETSLVSVHQGSDISGTNLQKLTWTGGRLLGLDILGGTAVAAINGGACGRLSVASVGARTCNHDDESE